MNRSVRRTSNTLPIILNGKQQDSQIRVKSSPTAIDLVIHSSDIYISAWGQAAVGPIMSHLYAEAGLT